ncbi:MAG: VanZ family protein [Flavobacteriaceae bacterium]
MRIFTWLYTIIVLVLFLYPFSSAKNLNPILTDKLIHFIVFTLFTILWFLSYANKKNYILILILIAVFSSLVELLQFISPYGRSFSLLDILSNIFGIIFGFFILVSLKKKLF